MKPLFQPHLVNDPFGDPVLYVDFLYERRAMLFDLGELRSLPTKKLLRISHGFVSHTHMDHFMGFDYLLRVCLGRNRTLDLFGPPGFTVSVEHKLAGFTWNLVDNYEEDFTIVAHDVLLPDRLSSARFRCRNRFRREHAGVKTIADGVVLDEPGFRVRTAELDHGVPCLGFCFEEKIHVNIWKNRIDEMGLPSGPWLKDLKDAVVADRPADTPFRLCWVDARGSRERTLTLGELRESALRIVPGQKIGYVTDALGSEENSLRIVDLVRGADQLFIETFFLNEDAARARKAFHLTAEEAGRIARRAGAKRIFPMHVSPRYSGRYDVIAREAARAFSGEVPPGS